MTKILLVEDDKSLREIYGVRLLAEGYDIVSAGDGEEALAMAIKERPQLIVSDVMMPKISGFDMLDILRSTTETKEIKVIMMTALSSDDQRQRGEQLGADRYLVKSQVGIEDVVRTVHEVLGDLPGAAAPTPQQAFAAPSTPAQPSAAPAPQSTSPAPQPPVQPTAVPPQPQPVQPAPAAPVPAPQQSTPPADTAPPSSLPEPTAPFSTPRPANLGQRVIQPLTQDTAAETDVAARMSQELESTAAPAPTLETPAAPTDAAPAPSTSSADEVALATALEQTIGAPTAAPASQPQTSQPEPTPPEAQTA